MSLVFSATLRNARANLVLSAIDAGAAAGRILFYDASNNQIASVTLDKPSGTVSGGVLTFADVPANGQFTANGTISYCTFVDSDGNVVMTASVTVTGGAGPVTVDTLTGYSGGYLIVNSGGTLTE